MKQEEYEACINEAKKIAEIEGKTLSEWELEVWDKQSNKNRENS